MKGWTPKEKSPLPPAGDEYTEIDAAFEWKIPLDKWEQIHPEYRAKMTAFILHRNLRHGYCADKGVPEKKRGSGRDDENYDALMRDMN